MKIIPGRLLLLAIATVAAGIVGLTAQATERFAIDPAASTITLQAGKSGVFSFAGHDHEIVAPVSDGEIALDRLDISRSRISIRFDAKSLKVTGRGEPAGDVAEVQQVMLSDRVLNVQNIPSHFVYLTHHVRDEALGRSDHGAGRWRSRPARCHAAADPSGGCAAGGGSDSGGRQGRRAADGVRYPAGDGWRRHGPREERRRSQLFRGRQAAISTYKHSRSPTPTAFGTPRASYKMHGT